jgi:hypothetical protein
MLMLRCLMLLPPPNLFSNAFTILLPSLSFSWFLYFLVSLVFIPIRLFLEIRAITIGSMAGKCSTRRGTVRDVD